jgi:thiol-disulfide isomerase/thioredoxin
MRKIVVLFFICSSLISCKNIKDEVSITGKVSNPVNKYLLMNLPEGGRDTVRIDGDGNFEWSMKAPGEPILCSISCNDSYMPLYLRKGMSLNLVMNAEEIPGSLHFEGTGSDMNNYLGLMATKEKDLKLSDYEIFKKDTATFFEWNDGVRETQLRLLNEFKKSDPGDAFWKMQMGEVVFGWANRQQMYPSYYRYYTDSSFRAKDDYNAFMDRMEINNPGYINSQEFKSFISSYINMKASAEMSKYASDSIKPTRAMLTMKTAIEIIKNDSVRNSFLASYAKSLLTFKDFSEITNELKFFRDNCGDKKLQDKFEMEYQARLLIQKGQPEIDFTGETAGGEKIKLSDFRGKYVYVDVWATWCGPCKYEIPYLKKLEEDYHAKNIVFLSYSIDEDRAAWVKFVPENELKGVQIIGEKGWQSQLCKDYKIFGVPTFMLFDREGKIFSVNMSRPSDERTRKTFDSLTGI